MSESSTQVDRPIPITVICWIGFVGAPLTMALAFFSSSSKVPEWVAAYAFFGPVFRFVTMLGLWRMRRLAVFALILVCLCNTAVSIIAGKPGGAAIGFAWFAVELAIVFLYFRRMT